MSRHYFLTSFVAVLLLCGRQCPPCAVSQSVAKHQPALDQALADATDNNNIAGDYSIRLKAMVTAIMAEAGWDAESVTEDYSQSVALSAFAEAQHLSGDANARQTFQQAQREAGQIKDAYAREEALKTLAKSQFEADDTSGARRSLLDATLAASNMPSNGPQDWVSRRDFELRKVGVEQAGFGYLTDAQTTAALIRDRRTKSEVTSIVAERQLKVEEFSQAIQTMRDADGHDVAIVLSEVAEAQIKAARVAQAHRTIADALQAAGTITRPAAKATAWSSVAVAQAQAGDEAGALQTAAKIRDNDTKVNTLTKIIKARISRGDLTGAGRVADMITECIGKCRALQAIAEAQSKSGDTVVANRTASAAQQLAAPEGDNSDKWFALYAIAQVQLEAKNLAGARRTLQAATAAALNIKDKDISTMQVYQTAISQIEAGDPGGARKNVDECATDANRLQTLEDIAELQIQAGHKASARDTLRDASETLSAFLEGFQDSNIADLTVCGHTVAEQGQAGDLTGALTTLRQLRQTADRVPDAAGKSIALSDIVIGLFEPLDKSDAGTT